MHDRDPSAAPSSNRPLRIASAVFMLSMAACLALIWHLHQRAVQSEHRRVAALSDTYAHSLQSTVEHALSSTYTLATMVHQGNGQVSDFEGAAAEILARYAIVSALGLAPHGVVQRVAPMVGNEKLIGFSPLLDAQQGKEARLARDTGKLALTGPIKIGPGNLGLVAQLPVFLNDTVGKPVFWGMTYAVIPLPQILASANLDQLANNGLQYELWRMQPDTGDRQIISASQATPLPAPVNQSLEMPNGQWTLSTAPIGGWISGANLVGMGTLAFVFSVLLGYATKLLLELKAQQDQQGVLIAKRASEISASENDLKATLDAIPDMILELGLDGTCHAYNASRTDATFLPSEFLLSKNISLLLSPEATQGVMMALQLADRTGYAKGHEFSYTTPDNVQQWFEISITRKQDAPNGESRFIALTRNVSQRKITETYLRVAAVAFTSHEGMAVTDAKEEVLRVNPSFT